MPDQPQWTVIHYNHDGNKLAEVAPEQLSWGRYLNRPGYINYDVDYQVFAARPQNVGAYRTDFALMRNDLPIIAGLHTAVSADMDELVIHVAGYGWLHYLEMRVWPFAMGKDQSASGMSWFATDVGDIVTDMVNTVSTTGESVEFVMQSAQLGITTNYRIEPADSENIFEKITSLSQQKPGFDFQCTNDKQFIMYVPEKGDYVRDYSLELGRNVKSVHYGDNGPVGNAVLGVGAGSATKVGYGTQDLDAQAIYRRLDQIEDFGDDPNTSNITRMTRQQLDRSKNPNLDIWVSVYPEEFDKAYTSADVGDYMHVIADMEYVQLDDYFRITGIEGYLNAQGDEQLVFTFNDNTTV